MARPWFALLLLLTLPGCGGRPAKTWTNPVTDVTCGPVKLHFEERAEDKGFPSGARFYTPALVMDDGHGPTVVDAIGSHDNPAAYARLLPPSARFHAFDAGEKRWSDRYHTPSWVLFVDPAQVSDAQYGALAQCLDENLPAIDAAWDRKRTPEENWELATDRRYRLAAMLHLKHEGRFSGPERVALGPIWECPGGTFLKPQPEAGLFHCIKDLGGFCDAMGAIQDDGTTIALYPVGVLNPNLMKAAGGDPAKFYGACRDASGKGLFDTLKPVPWKDRR